MLLFVLAYVGGVLTILSPCILPVLPFVFSRAGRPFVTSTMPMMAGMALTFAAVATLAAVGGGWAVQANAFGRYAAIALLATFGATLLFPALADRLARPAVALGARLANTADRRAGRGTAASSLLIGVATGLLWAPCAGPILGLILTGAALHGASVQTTLLLTAYAAGAATSMAVALLLGGRVFTALKRSLGAGVWLRRGAGAAIVMAVLAIALGLDTGLLTRVALAGTAPIEQRLLDRLKPAPADESGVLAEGDDAGMMMMGANPVMKAAAGASLAVEGVLPQLDGAVEWLNTPPLTAEALKGKVVLVDFWTYSCVNCLRALPYVKAWAEKYRDQGLVVIGVHAPEFAFERDIGNVKRAVADLGVTYPVAIDNNYAIWRAFGNQFWPAHYFIDARGLVRHHHFGEGDYDGSERIIQQLLVEAGHGDVPAGAVRVTAEGAQAAPDMQDVRSPETYVGYERARNFTSTAVHDASHVYEAGAPQLNEWGLNGAWTVGGEDAALNGAGGAIVYRFHARDLHLVLGPNAAGAPVRFQVSIDGAAPGASHGADAGADGAGLVTGQRLYQLVRLDGPVADHTFEIRFLDPGVRAYAFTFG